MGLTLFSWFLVINAFNIATENPVTPEPYRFTVYPVNECPRSENEFKTAAQRRNCTRGLRYLCAPNKNLSSLIEFCTDRQRSLYAKGNCVILEGTGDLDHYSCVEKFNGSCPSKPYLDDEIYKYPACLEINKDHRCFVADRDCNKGQFPTCTTGAHLNISEIEKVRHGTFRGASHGWLAIGYIIAIAVVLAVIILIWIIFQKRKKAYYAICIQHSFTILTHELPDEVVQMMGHVLNQSNLSDIERLTSIICKKAKLLKILLLKGEYACKELFKTLSSRCKRYDLIEIITKNRDDMTARGRPVLIPSLKYLTTSCLKDFEDLLQEELEPIEISDRLFEERAIDIFTHDKITETRHRRQQIKYLLETVQENRNDCFHFFLFILQERFKNICDELQKPTLAGDVQNEAIKLHLSVSGHTEAQIEHALTQRLCSDDLEIYKEVISHEQMDIDGVIHGNKGQ